MPVRSYLMREAHLTLAKSSSSPSARKTGSSTHGAIRLGSPMHFASPRSKVTVHLRAGAWPTYGSSSLISGLPSEKDSRSRLR